MLPSWTALSAPPQSPIPTEYRWWCFHHRPTNRTEATPTGDRKFQSINVLIVSDESLNNICISSLASLLLLRQRHDHLLWSTFRSVGVAVSSHHTYYLTRCIIVASVRQFYWMLRSNGGGRPALTEMIFCFRLLGGPRRAVGKAEHHLAQKVVEVMCSVA